MQGDLEAALGKLLGQEVHTVGAGRTDAGVHALGQVMSFANPIEDSDVDPIKVRDALNAMCGPAIAVNACKVVPDEWHARFNAKSRTYVYAILGSEAPDPWLARTALYHREPLDLEAMNEAAGHLVGAHDFGSFGRVADPQASAERVLYELKCMQEGSLIRIRARANSFIQQMVRSLVGTLVQVGEDRRSPDEMAEILTARDRSAAGPVASAHGLCLVSVEYDDGWSSPVDPTK